MEPAWKRDLEDLVASVKSRSEAAALLRALLTPAEYKDIAQRWQIVKHLLEGNPQRLVRDKVQVSIAKITRGSREIQYGNGAFKKFYHRLFNQ